MNPPAEVWNKRLKNRYCTPASFELW